MSPAQIDTRPEGRFYRRALFDSFLKLDPRQQTGHPVLIAGEVISLLLTGMWLWALLEGASVRMEIVTGMVALWLWLTVLLTNFADALAEGRNRTQPEPLYWPRHPVDIKWLKLPPAGD